MTALAVKNPKVPPYLTTRRSAVRRPASRLAWLLAASTAVLVMLSVALLLSGCAKTEEAKPAPEPSVSGDTVSFPEQKDPAGVRLATVGGNAGVAITVPGRLTWDEDRTTRVFAPYAGRIERLRAAVGQSVKRGQPLADVASADIGQAQAELHKAAADLSLSRSNLERVRELAEAGVVARKDLQQAEADQARAQAESARAQARLSQYGVAAKSVTQAFSLNAPIDGVVVERNANPGAEVRTDVQGPPLFTISDPSSLWAVLDLDETQLAAFKVGDSVELRSTAWPDMEFKARIISVAAAVDPVSRTVKVRAVAPNPRAQLKAEMFITATASLPVALPVVPADAVFLRGEKSFLFIQRGPGRFERREVRLRGAGPQSWMVLQGANAGERVVVGGGLYLNQLLDAGK